jgi:hypothetical protein
MKGQWSEYFRLIAIGELTIACVAPLAYFLRYDDNTMLQRLRRLEGVRSTSNAVLNPSPQPGAASPVRRVSDRDPVRASLVRAWSYLAAQHYEPSIQNQVVGDLITAYRTPHLSAESNRALLSAIQQVNEIGVAHAISEADRLPPSDAVRGLQTLLRSAPTLQLTKRQKHHLESALVRHGRRPSNTQILDASES